MSLIDFVLLLSLVANVWLVTSVWLLHRRNEQNHRRLITLLDRGKLHG